MLVAYFTSRGKRKAITFRRYYPKGGISFNKGKAYLFSEYDKQLHKINIFRYILFKSWQLYDKATYECKIERD